MRIKSLLLTLAICGAFVAASAQEGAVADSTSLIPENEDFVEIVPSPEIMPGTAAEPVDPQVQPEAAVEPVDQDSLPVVAVDSADLDILPEIAADTVAMDTVAADAQSQVTGDTTMLGVHPFKETRNLTQKTTGFSLVFHGGVNVFNGDYPMSRFVNFGGPALGIDVEYNFTPAWAIGAGYNFAWPKVRTSRADYFRNADGSSLQVDKGTIVHEGMIHSGQIYVSYDLMKAWYPRATKDIFSLKVFAGFGAAWYHNMTSFNDFESTNPDGTHSDSGKYVKDEDGAHAHKSKDAEGNYTKDAYANVGFMPLGATAEFSISRAISLGARVQYDLFLNDYLDNRYEDKANKNNDGMFDVEVMLRWKIAARKKNHMTNVSSVEVLEEKIYTSHPHLRPRNYNVDTVMVYNRDTLIVVHRDTVVLGNMHNAIETTSSAATLDQIRDVDNISVAERDLELRPGWELEAEAVVVEGQSLSRLARRYYHNTFCWVYLWIANRNVAPDPNLILPKCVLQVPKLNAVQKSVTKQEAKDMAARYRGE